VTALYLSAISKNSKDTIRPIPFAVRIPSNASFGAIAMSKRAAEASQQEAEALKGGERPEKAYKGDDVGEFEDEFEDEFESEDEIMEAGVDGRPDEEREAEEEKSTSAWHYYNAVYPRLHRS
jgi:hypothetical protein